MPHAAPLLSWYIYIYIYIYVYICIHIYISTYLYISFVIRRTVRQMSKQAADRDSSPDDQAGYD